MQTWYETLIFDMDHGHDKKICLSYQTILCYLKMNNFYYKNSELSQVFFFGNFISVNKIINIYKMLLAQFKQRFSNTFANINRFSTVQNELNDIKTLDDLKQTYQQIIPQLNNHPNKSNLLNTLEQIANKILKPQDYQDLLPYHLDLWSLGMTRSRFVQRVIDNCQNGPLLSLDSISKIHSIAINSKNDNSRLSITDLTTIYEKNWSLFVQNSNLIFNLASVGYQLSQQQKESLALTITSNGAQASIRELWAWSYYKLLPSDKMYQILNNYLENNKIEKINDLNELTRIFEIIQLCTNDLTNDAFIVCYKKLSDQIQQMAQPLLTKERQRKLSRLNYFHKDVSSVLSLLKLNIENLSILSPYLIDIKIQDIEIYIGLNGPSNYVLNEKISKKPTIQIKEQVLKNIFGIKLKCINHVDWYARKGIQGKINLIHDLLQ